MEVKNPQLSESQRSENFPINRWESSIPQQIEYIETVRNLVAEALSGDREITTTEQEQIITQLEK